MDKLTLTTEAAHRWFTPVDNYFITDYLPEANGDFVKVYIFSLHHLFFSKEPLTVAQISKSLDILESDVVKAWQYWSSKGLVSVKEDKDKNTIIQFNVQVTNNVVDKQKVVLDTRPNYSPEELSIYISNSKEIRLLFKTAEEKLGKLLSSQDTSILFSLYDWLRLPVEVIIMLMEYCCSANKRNIRYIEKVAIEWADNEITSVDKAERWLKTAEDRNMYYNTILNSLGLYRNPTKFEKQYIDKWINEWKFVIELVLKACEITINITNPSFKYIDSILASWHTNNIKTIEAADIFVEEYRSQKTKTSKPKTIKAKTTTNNRFHNFPERDYDFEEIEEKIREKQLKKHGG